MSRKFTSTFVLHLAWFPALFVAWGAIAGQSGSPVPGNWPVLDRMLDVIEVSMLATLLLLVVMPLAAWASARRSRWAAAYPILLLSNCGGTVVLCAIAATQGPSAPVFLALSHYAPTHTPSVATSVTAPHKEPTQVSPQPVFVAPPHNPCWRFGQTIPAVDAAGKSIGVGDLVVIRPATGSDGPLPDTPEQAVQRKAWEGRIVVVEGTMQGDALRFRATGADASREAPRFCLWPDNVEHARTH